ncbi:MAG: beta-Ala-His dipeptidase [Lachnospiraceae bacterium]|nr:beta-Ala-His dipeptidase [Lachnospiraceae bacterium]
MSKQITPTLTNKVYESTMHFFRELSKIPRSSGEEQKCADFFVDFAKKRGFSYKRTTDIINGRQTCNVVITKPGTPGYEDLDILILQSHMDMVCQKTKDSTHDFATDPLELIVKDNYMTAKDTTLGADDGIGVAMTLAFLDSNEISHPPLEALFTSDEEAGMSGVQAIGVDFLQGRHLINIDSEEEGIFTYGCACGINVDIEIPATYESPASEAGFLEIEVTGLVGGHSGGEIHKGRANSNRLLARVLNEIFNTCNIHLVSVVGGDKRNVITRESSAKIAVPSTYIGKIKEIAKRMEATFSKEYKGIEDSITVTVSEITKDASKVLSAETTEKFILCLLVIPNGLQAMHSEIPELVGTSCNIGILYQDDTTLKLQSSVRSCNLEGRHYLTEQFRSLARLMGVGFTKGFGYPNWEPNPDSDLIKRFQKAYHAAYDGKEPKLKSTNGGLECGFIRERFPDMDLISCGPNVTGAHTIEETLDLTSTKRTVGLLLHVLAQT